MYVDVSWCEREREYLFIELGMQLTSHDWSCEFPARRMNFARKPPPLFSREMMGTRNGSSPRRRTTNQPSCLNEALGGSVYDEGRIREWTCVTGKRVTEGDVSLSVNTRAKRAENRYRTKLPVDERRRTQGVAAPASYETTLRASSARPGVLPLPGKQDYFRQKMDALLLRFITSERGEVLSWGLQFYYVWTTSRWYNEANLFLIRYKTVATARSL